MKMKNRILKGLLIAGMLTSVTVMQAQDLPHDTLKVMYPGDSTVVEIPSSQDKYIEEKAILTPDDEGKLTSVLRKDSVGMVKKQGRDWSKWRPNPKRALWLALVIPGAGQVYNRKYWKLPIFYGGFVGCVYAMTWNNRCTMIMRRLIWTSWIMTQQRRVIITSYTLELPSPLPMKSVIRTSSNSARIATADGVT